MSTVLARVGDTCMRTPKELVHTLAHILQEDGILRKIAEVVEGCSALGIAFISWCVVDAVQRNCSRDLHGWVSRVGQSTACGAISSACEAGG